MSEEWTSLEIAKFAVSVSIPISVFVLGWLAKRVSAMREAERHRQAAKLQQRHISEERVAAWRYDKFQVASSLLNDIYCYFIYVGKWKELTPDDVISRKRETDSVVYPNELLFSKDLIQAYEEFSDTAFRTFGGWGKDAKLRTSVDHRKEAAKGRFEWIDNWDERFTEEDKRDELKAAYKKLFSQFAWDLGVQESAK